METLVQSTAMLAYMRYTEARLSKIAMEMLRDIQKDTIPLCRTDGEERAVRAPGAFPNLLVNGISRLLSVCHEHSSAQSGEVIDGLKALIENPDLTP